MRPIFQEFTRPYIGLQARRDLRENDFCIKKTSFTIISNLSTKCLGKVFIRIRCSLFLKLF